MLPLDPSVISLLQKGFALQDPLGRSFDSALTSARNRAASALWNVPELAKVVAYADFRALALQSALVVSLLTPEKRPDDVYSDRWGAAMSRTATMLAEPVGYTGQPLGDVKQSATKDTSAEIPVIVIVGIVIGVLAIAGAFAWIIYKSLEVVDRELARGPAADELVRLHTQAEKIISDHFEAEKQVGHSIPWSQSELDVLDRLEKEQYAIIHGMTPEPQPFEAPALGSFGLGGLVGAAAVIGGLWFAVKKGWV
jgi:hypothetical protein